MCFSNLSGCDLVNLASALAISVSKNFNADDLALLAAFFTSFADNLALLSTRKSF